MKSKSTIDREEIWPALPLEAWKDTYETLHLWSQIVGKIPLELSPPINHWWEVAYEVSARGIRTRPIPMEHRIFEMEFDFIDHVLKIRDSDGERREMALAQKTVAEFYHELMWILDSIGLYVEINPLSQEMAQPIRCDEDRSHASYDPEYANKFWRALIQANRLFEEFRAGFVGKSSPVNFYWGTFDLAVSRYSGRRAPARPGVDGITREAYSHEVMSVGFWPGSGNIRGPAFYAYAAPEPEGFAEFAIRPRHAFYNPPTRGFILMYDEVRNAEEPERMVREFMESSYAAAADLGRWNRAELDRQVLPGKAA